METITNLVADGERVRLHDGTHIATVWEIYPSEERLPGESWLEMRDRTQVARDAAKKNARVLASQFAASKDLLQALEIVLEREQITSATRALIEHTLRRAKGG